jgi:flagellar basal-body rod modification protein FlgD
MATAAVGATGASALGIQDFLRILTAQLNNQDPLKPMDNQEFVAQLAQFASLQQTQLVNEKLDSLLSTEAAMRSVGLLGRSVELNTPSGTTSATVTEMTFNGADPRLTVRMANGSIVRDVSLSSVIVVR